MIGFSIDASHYSVSELIDRMPNHSVVSQLAVVGISKVLAAPVVNTFTRHFNSEFVGSGSEQLVMRRSLGQIIKLLKPTFGSSLEQAGEQSHRYQNLSDTAGWYLGDKWLETEFYPVKLPKIIGGYAVAAGQPEIQAIKSFKEPEDLLGHSTSEDFLTQVSDLVYRIRSFNTQTGMYPDLFGDGNVLIDADNNIRIVDTIPETPDKLETMMWWDSPKVTRRQAHEIALELWGEFSRSASSAGYESPALALH